MAGKCEHGLTTRECLACASPKYGAPASGPRKATDAEIAEWAERHDLRGSATDLRAAFEDAASLHLTRGVAASRDAEPDAIAYADEAMAEQAEQMQRKAEDDERALDSDEPGEDIR